jgi:uncharacterized alkaline shock family protein YloU
MHKSDHNRGELGGVKVYKSAISSLVSIAALEIPGVKAIAGNFWSSLFDLFGRRYSQIYVDIGPHSDEISVSVPLVIAYGYNVVDVAAKVQENVRSALERSTNLNVRDVHVKIKEIQKEAAA